MHAKMTIGDHVALWNGSLRHKMHTPAPPRLPCWSSAQVTLVYNGPLTQDKPLSVGAAQKTSCMPRGISTSLPPQPLHPREGKWHRVHTALFALCPLHQECQGHAPRHILPCLRNHWQHEGAGAHHAEKCPITKSSAERSFSSAGHRNICVTNSAKS